MIIIKLYTTTVRRNFLGVRTDARPFIGNVCIWTESKMTSTRCYLPVMVTRIKELPLFLEWERSFVRAPTIRLRLSVS